MIGARTVKGFSRLPAVGLLPRIPWPKTAIFSTPTGAHGLLCRHASWPHRHPGWAHKLSAGLAAPGDGPCNVCLPYGLLIVTPSKGRVHGPRGLLTAIPIKLFTRVL